MRGFVMPFKDGSPSREDFRRKTKQLELRLSQFSQLFKSRNFQTPDDLFFSIEDLPSMGKEYWFLYFCTPGSDEQVILTLGRSADPVKVNNGTELEAAPAKGSVPCAGVCWYYSKGKKQVVFDSHANVSLGGGKAAPHRISAQRGKNRISIAGKYPTYDVELDVGGKRVFSARASPAHSGKPYEMVHMLKTPIAPRFGAWMINYYFDFTGTLAGKRLAGKAYLQKVVAAIPLTPWNWIRLEFESGAALDVFAAKPLGDGHIKFAANAYFENEGKRHPVKGLKLESWLSGERRIWVLSGKGLLAVMESYGLQPFIMKQKTVFRYDEYIVCVKSFAIDCASNSFTLEELGQGRGIVEEASGYLL